MTRLSTVAVDVISFAVTGIVSVTVAAIITFIVTYLCVKKTLGKANNTILTSWTSQSCGPQEKVLYEQVSVPSHTVIKNDLELQANPAYGTSHKVVMDTNSAYERCN